MLLSIFHWLDNNPGSYWAALTVPTLLLLGRVGFVAWQEIRGRPARPEHGGVAALLLFLFLLAWRWPFLFSAAEFNPDESQHIAGALTLTQDPVFWRAVDGNTSGPLNFYILLPLHWLGLPIDYFTARLTGLLLIGGALLACLRALGVAFGRTAAWMAVLPAVVFFATVTHHDLLQYSTETLPLLLIAAPAWLLAGRGRGGGVRLWSACFLAGSAPWAKLQAAPLALVLVGWGCWQVLHDLTIPGKLRWQRAAGAGLAAATPTLLVAALTVATGQAETAWRRYILHNLVYAGQGSNRTLGETLLEMKDHAMPTGQFPLLLVTTLAFLFVATLCFIFRRVRPPGLFAAGGALTLAAVVAIIAPRREYLHYVLFLPVPLTLWLGAAVGGWWLQPAAARFRGLLAGVLIAGGGLFPLILRSTRPVPEVYGKFAYDWQHPRSSVAMLVQALAGRGDALGVWGWACNLHAETGLPQATRDGLSSWSILPGPYRDYHRTAYLADLRRRRPAVFVDAVGPGAYSFYVRELQAHETFPELAVFVRENYDLVRDVRVARIYARKDVAARAALDPRQIDRLLARGRSPESVQPRNPVLTPMEMLTRKELGGRTVSMMLPPTAVAWPLDQDVRAFSVEFGFDPEAQQRGASNGAEVILELLNFGQTRQIYRRLLDPAREPGDRGLQSVLLHLPPFNPGTQLILRTAPGELGDAAWDWIYLVRVQFQRSPAFLPGQFPGFHPLPDFADADNSYLLDEGQGPVLQLDPPATLSYVLSDAMRRLRLAYGIRPGAYTNGGHSDGVVIRLELQGHDRKGRILHERGLDPANNPADRGLQHLDLSLSGVQPGDRLVLSIDPGPNGDVAWDWIYVAGLTID